MNKYLTSLFGWILMMQTPFGVAKVETYYSKKDCILAYSKRTGDISQSQFSCIPSYSSVDEE